MDYQAGRDVVKDLLMQRFGSDKERILSIESLEYMCMTYYELFLSKSMPYRPDFKVEHRGRRDGHSAGRCIKKAVGVYVIAFNPHELARMGETGAYIDGREVRGIIDAAAAVAEHELTHMAEFTLYGSSSHGKRFKLLGEKLFGRSLTAPTKYKLDRLTETQQFARRSTELAVGDRVKFNIPSQGEVYGVIKRIVKRATVEVTSGSKKGAEFYVPLNLLSRADRD